MGGGILDFGAALREFRKPSGCSQASSVQQRSWVVFLVHILFEMRLSYLPYKIVVSHSGLKCLEKMKCIVIILESLSWVATLN